MGLGHFGAASCLALLFAQAALAQVFVLPRRAGKTPVRTYSFEWRHVDILVGPEADTTGAGADGPPSTKPVPSGVEGLGVNGPAALPHPAEEELATGLTERSGGVRLYFYERERPIAARAAAQISRSYRYLSEQFHYVPNRTLPYVLYSSYGEFLQTNLFPLSEGTLGVTSTQGDFRLTLPYFGDDRLFEDVSTHEMAHQFTLQKVRTYARRAKAGGNPLDAVPLWFVEGLAELYAKRGLDDEAKLLVRDLLLNPDVQRGYALVDFFSEEPLNFLWIYKVGQARCAFLEAEYGAGTVQRVLEASPLLVKGGGWFRDAEVKDFKALLTRLTGDTPAVLAQKFERWLKRGAYDTFLQAKQDPTTALRELREPDGGEALEDVDTLAVSPNGELLLVRTMDRTTGVSSLKLLDRRDPATQVVVARDGVPGTESLHAVFGRNFALTDKALAFIAEAKDRDVLYLVPFEHTLAPREREEDERPEPLPKRSAYEASFSLGHRTAYRLSRRGVLAATSPAFSPDGRQVAFVGMSEDGQRDVWVLTPGADATFTLARATSDLYAERHVSWGPRGIVYTSDATEHGRFNLFQVVPGEPPVRLTTEAVDCTDPVALPDGRLFFVAYDDGRANLQEYVDGEVVRRTDLATGLMDPHPGPDGTLWALHHRGGRRWPVQLPPEALLSLDARAQPEGGAPRPLPEEPLDAAEPYREYAVRNWQLGPAMGYFGASGHGVVGELVGSANDRLNNHALLLSVAVLGTFEATEGYLLYLNQERRVTWAVGPFQSLNFRNDPTFPGIPLQFTSVERFWGLTSLVRYPFDEFLYAQAELAVGGANYFVTPYDRSLLEEPALSGGDWGDLYPAWREANAGTRLQTQVTARLGYDTLLVHPLYGPLSGTSLLLENVVGVQPLNRGVFGNVRLDAQRYLQLIGRSHLVLRAGAGTAYGGKLARPYYLSSFDTLRGARFGDTNWLLGRHYGFSAAELRVPLDVLVRVAFLSNVEAVGGFDFGGVGDSVGLAWEHRVLDGVLGVNLGLGPFLFRLHFAHNIDTGAPAGVPAQGWVTNFSIRIAGLEGLLGAKRESRFREVEHSAWRGVSVSPP